MNINTERKLKFWISAIGKVLLMSFLLIRIYDYVKDQEQQTPLIPSSKSSEDVVLQSDSTIGQESSTNIQDEPLSKRNSKSTTPPMDIPVKILKNLSRDGQPLVNAKLVIDNCQGCEISPVDSKGQVSILVPKAVYESNYLHNFYIYHNDSLLLNRAMRLTDIQLNLY